MGEGRLRQVEQGCGRASLGKDSNALAHRRVDPVFPYWQIGKGKFDETLKQGALQRRCPRRRSTENRDPGDGKSISHG